MLINKSAIIEFLMISILISAAGCHTATATIDSGDEMETGDVSSDEADASVDAGSLVSDGPSLYSDEVVCPAAKETLDISLTTSGGASGDGFGRFELHNGELRILISTGNDCQRVLTDSQIESLLDEAEHIRWPDLKDDYSTGEPGTCNNNDTSFTFSGNVGECKLSSHFCESHLWTDPEVAELVPLTELCASIFTSIFTSCSF